MTGFRGTPAWGAATAYGTLVAMAEGNWYSADIDRVVVTEEQIRDKTDELAKEVA